MPSLVFILALAFTVQIGCLLFVGWLAWKSWWTPVDVTQEEAVRVTREAHTIRALVAGSSLVRKRPHSIKRSTKG